MEVEIWVLEKEVERLRRLCTSWPLLKDMPDQSIKYMTIPHKVDNEWICIHIKFDDYIMLANNNLLIKHK